MFEILSWSQPKAKGAVWCTEEASKSGGFSENISSASLGQNSESYWPGKWNHSAHRVPKGNTEGSAGCVDGPGSWEMLCHYHFHSPMETEGHKNHEFLD